MKFPIDYDYREYFNKIEADLVLQAFIKFYISWIIQKGQIEFILSAFSIITEAKVSLSTWHYFSWILLFY